jgi:trehalose synthase
VTRKIYDSIQGVRFQLTKSDWRIYENFNKQIADEIGEEPWDLVLVQDHQMTGALSQVQHRGKTKWIWQSHSETHNPDTEFLAQFNQYVTLYDGVVFYFPDYFFSGLMGPQVLAFPLAIDPLTRKNRDLKSDDADRIMESFGVDCSRPVVTQISRVNLWKDFPGVADAWLLVKQEIPEVQLVLIGAVSPNNIQAMGIIEAVKEKARNQSGCHILINEVGFEAVKGFQVGSDVVIQKSLREGFGLTVSEALWSRTPVVGGNVGGIRAQVVHGRCGYLVDTVEDCARRTIELLGDARKAAEMGDFGREHVRRHFLMPRLISDHIDLMRMFVA